MFEYIHYMSFLACLPRHSFGFSRGINPLVPGEKALGTRRGERARREYANSLLDTQPHRHIM